MGVLDGADGREKFVGLSRAVLAAGGDEVGHVVLVRGAGAEGVNLHLQAALVLLGAAGDLKDPAYLAEGGALLGVIPHDGSEVARAIGEGKREELARLAGEVAKGLLANDKGGLDLLVWGKIGDEYAGHRSHSS